MLFPWLVKSWRIRRSLTSDEPVPNTFHNLLAAAAEIYTERNHELVLLDSTVMYIQPDQMLTRVSTTGRETPRSSRKDLNLSHHLPKALNRFSDRQIDQSSSIRTE